MAAAAIAQGSQPIPDDACSAARPASDAAVRAAALADAVAAVAGALRPARHALETGDKAGGAQRRGESRRHRRLDRALFARKQTGDGGARRPVFGILAGDGAERGRRDESEDGAGRGGLGSGEFRKNAGQGADRRSAANQAGESLGARRQQAGLIAAADTGDELVENVRVLCAHLIGQALRAGRGGGDAPERGQNGRDGGVDQGLRQRGIDAQRACEPRNNLRRQDLRNYLREIESHNGFPPYLVPMAGANF